MNDQERDDMRHVLGWCCWGIFVLIIFGVAQTVENIQKDLGFSACISAGATLILCGAWWGTVRRQSRYEASKSAPVHCWLKLHPHMPGEIDWAGDHGWTTCVDCGRRYMAYDNAVGPT